MYKGVIFDCDGVLVDSELLGCTAAAECLRRAGVETTLSEIQLQMTGKSNKEMFEIYEARNGIVLNHHDLNHRIEEEYMLLAEELKPMPGIVSLLEKLTTMRIPLTVASSGDYRKIAFSLEKTGLKKFFNIICSASDVPRGKPEPDLFLYAAQKMNIEPVNCIVVEDSLYGIAAGKKAKMFTVGYTSSFSKEELRQAGADVVIDQFDQFLSTVGI
jgi:HAD superfamily hydrolase (TIGR01509 family)